MAFRPEPPHQHGRPVQTAVVLCNLGTPAKPDAASVRRYLAQFLSDKRVVEISHAIWKPLLHGVILRTRPARSAAKYAKIWRKDGSPLLVWTQRQATLLQGWLGHHGHEVKVVHAMRYGEPAIGQVLDQLKAAGVGRVLVLPAYPQYSGTTTASVMDSIFDWGKQIRHLPEWRFINHYHTDVRYIDALATQVRKHWQQYGRGQKLVMSFHGVPARTLDLGDPYHCECQVTARLLAEHLGLAKDDWVVTFQSRFGKARWLEPATQPTVEMLARQGLQHIDVICPGFTADCLETLEEIDMEVREAYLKAGGQRYEYIPCLNDDPAWIDAMGRICEQHLAGWPTVRAEEAVRQEHAQALRDSAVRARAMGAPT